MAGGRKVSVSIYRSRAGRSLIETPPLPCRLQLTTTTDTEQRIQMQNIWLLLQAARKRQTAKQKRDVTAT